ncbi:MAG: glyoxalase [Tetrasphaera sp.]|jgi:catechol 2,3-dioxygenase-like lactoylglutathione lyase family enzyme|nr:glyoxalase [Tetrasphaera sp.]
MTSFAIRVIDHVQLAIPPSGEAAARDFWVGLLGFTELPKPPLLAARGGCWFRAGDGAGAPEIHVGVEDPFVPARKAHPALIVSDLDALAARLTEAGLPVRWSQEIPGTTRFHTDDPFGNRLEFIDAGH